MAKKQVAFLPRNTSAETSIHPPWQIAATTFPLANTSRTRSTIALWRRIRSGA
jgi:hypothetical protein